MLFTLYGQLVYILQEPRQYSFYIGQTVRLPHELPVGDREVMNQTELEKLYLENDMSMEEIGLTCNVSRSTVSRWLSDFGIHKSQEKPIPSRDELVELYDSGLTIAGIGEKYGVSENLVSKWMRKLNIVTRNPNVSDKMPTEDVLRDHYESDKLTMTEIAKIYSVNPGTVQRWCAGFGINSRGNATKYAYLADEKLTQRQKEIVVGTVLGDCYIERSSKTEKARLSTSHGMKQYNYSDWKRQQFDKFETGIKINKDKTSNSWITVSHKEFFQFHQMFYGTGKKKVTEAMREYITPLSVAVLVMDDGSSGSGIYIHTNDFTREENELLSEMIEDKLEVKSYILPKDPTSSRYPDIFFNHEEAIKLSNIIRPHMHKDMKYKLVNYKPKKQRSDIPNAPPKVEFSDMYDRFTAKELQTYYGVGRKLITKWIKEYNIKKLSGAERKNHKLRKIRFTTRQREFLVGTLLGDGSIAKSGSFDRLTTGHSVKQLDYFNWKIKTMAPFILSSKASPPDKWGAIVHRFGSIGHSDFDEAVGLFYDNGKKVIKADIARHITAFSMAVWFMDDGSTKKGGNMKLSTEGFSYDENELLVKIVHDKFGIKGKVLSYKNKNKVYNYIAFGKEASIKLSKLIEPHMIDSMRYKLM